MRKLIIVLFCLISLVTKAQVYQEMPQYGYRANRMSFDSTLQIPTTCGVPTLKSVVNVSKKAAIAFDSCNNKFYQYNPKTLTWSEIAGGGGSTDTTSLSNRINTKIDSLKRQTDSVFAQKNGSWIFQYNGFVPYTGATTDVDLDTHILNAQAIGVKGTNGNGHIDLKHQSSDATATGQTTALFANSNGDLKWKNDNKYYTTLTTNQTADRVYSFQNKSYTLADSADVAGKQSQLNGTGFVKATGTTISYDNSTYVTTNTTQTITGAKTFTSDLKSTHYSGLSLEGTGTGGDANGINFKQYATTTGSGYPYNLLATRDSTAFLFSCSQYSGDRKSFYLDLSRLSLNTGYNVYVQNKSYTLADSADVESRVKYSDTSSSIATKTNVALKLNASDTASLSSRINAKGYALNLGATQFSYLANTTYYFGMPITTPSTTAAIRRVYIPQSGTIKGGQIYMRTTAATSTENWTLSIRLNNSSNTTFATLGNNSTDKIFATSSLSISVAAGDYIEIITTTPGWTTAPGNTFTYGSIFIQ